jgi:hypothetical protein
MDGIFLKDKVLRKSSSPYSNHFQKVALPNGTEGQILKEILDTK